MGVPVRPERESDPLELELEAVVKNLTQGAGIKARSF